MRWMWPGVLLGLSGCPAGSQTALEASVPTPSAPRTPDVLEVVPLADLPGVSQDGLRSLGAALASQVATGKAAAWPGLGVFERRVHPARDTGLSDFRLFRLKLGAAAQRALNPRKLVRSVPEGDEAWARGHEDVVLRLAVAITEALPTGGISVPGIGVFVVSGRPAPEGGGLIKSVSFRPEPALLEPLHAGHAKKELAIVLAREFYARAERK